MSDMRVTIRCGPMSISRDTAVRDGKNRRFNASQLIRTCVSARQFPSVGFPRC